MNQKIRRKGISFLNACDHFCDICAHASAWMMLAIALIISYEVVVRYFFNRPTIWVDDFTDYLLVYSTFGVSTWILRNDGHVRLTIILEHLSKRSQLVLDIINSCIGAVMCAFVVWFGVADTLDALVKSIEIPRPLPVPKYLIIWVIPFGFLLLFYQFLKNAFKFLKALKTRSS